MTIAETIQELRKDANLSQQEVASRLNIARATYSGLESGKREPTLPEIRGFAELYSVTIEQLIEGKLDTPLPESTLLEENLDLNEISPRDIPSENVNKFKNVLLYMLGKVGAKPNVGETVIYKLLYFVDFDFYEKTGEALIGAAYIKNHYGPTPVSFAKIVETMKNDEQIDVLSGSYFKYKQRKYMPRVQPNLAILTAEELEHINEVLQRLGDKSAKELSDLSHRDTPWIATKIGHEIDYQLAMYRTAETSVKEPEDEL